MIDAPLCLLLVFVCPEISATPLTLF